MKTLGFQTFLSNPEAEPRGIQLIKAFWLYGDKFYHIEKGGKRPIYNPLIGRVSKYNTIERLQIYYDLKVHHYIDIPPKK
jgi:hypothetical protein